MAKEIFPETIWSVVLEAASPEDPNRALSAFHQLCERYSGAIVLWMRGRGLSEVDAEDAAHEFLQHWLQRGNPLQNFERRQTRFRDFLAICLRDRLKSQISENPISPLLIIPAVTKMNNA